VSCHLVGTTIANIIHVQIELLQLLGLLHKICDGHCSLLTQTALGMFGQTLEHWGMIGQALEHWRMMGQALEHWGMIRQALEHWGMMGQALERWSMVGEALER